MPSRARTPAKALPRPRSMHFETLAQAQAAGTDSQPSSLETASAGTATPLMGHHYYHHAHPGGGGSSVFSSATGRQKWTDVLKDLPKRGWTASRAGTPSTPGTETEAEDYWSEKMDERKRERKRKRKKAEIYVRRGFSGGLLRVLTHCSLFFHLFRGADHAPCGGDHPAAGIHPQARARDDDVRGADA